MSLPAQAAGYDSNPGDVHAYDVRTGALRWVFHSLPQDGEVGADTWPKGARASHGGVHNWSELTIDEARGIAYVPFGTGRFDFYGGDRPGQNLFANSLVALDARTGRRLWHYQIVHHDVWDYDLPVSAETADDSPERPAARRRRAADEARLPLRVRSRDRRADLANRGAARAAVGRARRAHVAHAAVSHEAGAVRAAVVHRAGHQPVPARRRSARRLRERLRSYRNDGLFTPPSFRGSIEMPGHSGGTNWGGVAVDPGRRRAVRAVDGVAHDDAAAPARRQRARHRRARAEPTIVSDEEVGAAHACRRTRRCAKGPVRFTSPYDFMFTSTYLSPIGPPWSEIVAYDLNTGEIKWRVPHGSVAAPAALGIQSDSGAHWPRGGLLATGGGLLFAASGSDKTLRAYDRQTGKVVWTYSLPAASDGVPASYEAGGRQFIVVPVAAGHGWNPARFPTLPPPPASAYIAFALP